MGDNHLLTYAIDAKGYFSPLNFPKQLPEQMIVTCALDQSLNLDRVIIADLNHRLYCDACFEPPMPQPALGERRSSSVMAVTSSSGSPGRTAFSPSTPPAASRNALLDARSLFSAPAMADSSATARPSSDAPRNRAARNKKKGATDDQIKAQLKNPGGTMRNYRQVIKALHAIGLGVDVLRVNEALQNARGRVQLPSASDEQVNTHLKSPGGTERNQRNVMEAMKSAGLGVDANRISKQLQKERGVKTRRAASDDQIIMQLKNPGGTVRSLRGHQSTE